MDMDNSMVMWRGGKEEVKEGIEGINNHKNLRHQL